MAGLLNANASSVTLEVNGTTSLIAKDTGVVAAGAAGVSGNDLATIGQLPFIKEYVSAEQTITLGTVISLTHGIGVAPKFVTLSAVCKTAEHGYTVGDEIDVRLDTNNNSGGASVGRNTTTLRVIVGNPGGIPLHNATGGAVYMTTTNWRLIVRAWA